MEKQVIFRTTTFGGFDKRAVLDYIYKLNEETETAQSRMQEQVRELTEARQMLEAQISDYNERMRRMQRDLENANNELAGAKVRGDELAAMNEQLREEMEHQRDEAVQAKQNVVSNENKINELTAKNDELEAQNKNLRLQTADIDTKRMELESTTTQIGKLMVNAKNDADMLVSTAREESERVVSQAQQQADTMAAEAEAEAARIRMDAQQKVQEQINAAKQEAVELVAATTRSLDKTRRNFSEFRQQSMQMRDSIIEAAESILKQAQSIDSEIEAAEKYLHSVPDALVEECDYPDFKILQEDDLPTATSFYEENSEPVSYEDALRAYENSDAFQFLKKSQQNDEDTSQEPAPDFAPIAFDELLASNDQETPPEELSVHAMNMQNNDMDFNLGDDDDDNDIEMNSSQTLADRFFHGAAEM